MGNPTKNCVNSEKLNRKLYLYYHLYPKKSVGILTYLWESIEIHGSPLMTKDVHEYRGAQAFYYGSPWKPMDAHDYRCAVWASNLYLWISMVGR